MKVAVTGASGLIGRALVAALTGRGDEVTVLTRDPDRALRKAGRGSAGACAGTRCQNRRPRRRWPGATRSCTSRAQPVAQRWSERAKRAIRDSRVTGTRNLVEGLGELDADARPSVLISSSAIGYYGAHGAEPIDEEAPAGGDFLAQVCADWEAEARGGDAELQMRAVQVRTGVVLDRAGGALAKMLPPFRLGVGGPVAGGRQYVAWIHRDDLVGNRCSTRSGDERWSGPVNATAPEPVSNRDAVARARTRAAPPRAAARARGRAAGAVRGDGGDRHHRRARDARQGARAGLRVRASAAGAGAASGAGAERSAGVQLAPEHRMPADTRSTP